MKQISLKLKNYLEINNKFLGIFFVILTMICFTLMDAVAKNLMFKYNEYQVIWARYMSQTLLTILILIPVIIKVLKTKHFILQFSRSLLLFGATYLFFTSLKYLQLSEATAIFQIAPIIVTVLSIFILKEKVGFRRWIGVIFGLTGALIIIRPGNELFSIMILFPAIAALCYASYVIATKYLSKDDSTTTNFLYTTLIGSVFATLIVLPNWDPIEQKDLMTLSFFGLLGAIGHLFLIIAFKISEASFLAPFTYISLILGSLWGFIFFSEIPSIYTILGGALIVISGIYVWYRERKRKEI